MEENIQLLMNRCTYRRPTTLQFFPNANRNSERSLFDEFYGLHHQLLVVYRILTIRHAQSDSLRGCVVAVRCRGNLLRRSDELLVATVAPTTPPQEREILLPNGLQ